jgi:high-affinity K+ transport system ATPase subunit B
VLLDKTGTIPWQSHGTAFHPCADVKPDASPMLRNSRRSLMKHPKAAASSCWRKRNSVARRGRAQPHAKFIPFTARTRMSGVDFLH